MRKILILMMTLFAVLTTAGAVFADVVDPGPEITRSPVFPILLIVIAVVVIVLIIRARKKKG